MIFKQEELNSFIAKRGVDEEITYHDLDNLSEEVKNTLLAILDEYYVRSTDYYEEGLESVDHLMRWNDWESIQILAGSLKVFTDKGYNDVVTWFVNGTSYEGDALTYGGLLIDIKTNNINLDKVSV